MLYEPLVGMCLMELLACANKAVWTKIYLL